jgi:iron(III) transport system substrate-binding protein
VDVRIAACAEEGPVLIYGNPPQTFWDTVIPGFQQSMPGVEIETVDLGGQELIQRYLSEASVAGARSADILVESGPQTWLTLVEEGAVREYEPTVEGGLPASAVLMPSVYALEMTPSIIVYNKVIFDEESAPRSYADLLGVAEEYPGRIATYDITNTFGYAMFYSFVTDVPGGWEILESLLPATSPEASAGAMANKVAQGEYVAAYMMSGLLTGLLDDLGIEELVGWSYAEDGVNFLPRGMAVTNAGQNPTCAELFVDYLFSAEGQIAACTNGMFAPRDDIDEACAGSTVSAVSTQVGADNVWIVPYSADLAEKQDEITTQWQSLLSG